MSAGFVAMADAPVIRVRLCPGLRRRVSPKDVWHLIPFKLYEVSICLNAEDEPTLIVCRRLKDFYLLQSALEAAGVQVSARLKTRACHTAVSELQGYLRELLHSPLGLRSFCLKAFFSGSPLSVLQPRCCSGFPGADKLHRLPETALLKRSHNTFPEFNWWVRVWLLPPHLREPLLARQEEQNQRLSRYDARGQSRQVLDEDLQVLESEKREHMDPERVQTELLKLDSVSQQLQHLREQVQMDLDASTKMAEPCDALGDEFCIALPVRGEIDALAHAECERYSTELDAVRVLEVRATQEIFSRIMDVLLEDSAEHHRCLKQIEDCSGSHELKIVVPLEASLSRERMLMTARLQAKECLQFQRDNPNLGRPASNFDLYREEFLVDTDFHARALKLVREADADAEAVAQMIQESKEIAVEACTSWRATEDILQWPCASCFSPDPHDSFTFQSPSGKDSWASAETVAFRHGTLGVRFQSKVVKAIEQDERQSEKLRKDLRDMLEVLSEVGEQFRTEAAVRVSLEMVLREHTEIRQEKVDQLQRRILDAQREVEEKVHAYTVCRESLLHVEQRVTALVGSYEQDHSTIEQVVIGCHINVAVADLVEMVVHGSLPVRNEKIFSKPWKMCSEDVLQDVPYHLASKYWHDLVRAVALDNIELDCQQGALALLEQSGPSEKRQERAKAELPVTRKFQAELQSHLADCLEWQGLSDFEVHCGEPLRLFADDPALREALHAVDSVRNSCNDLLDNLERALAEVGRLVLTLSGQVSKEEDLRARGKELFKKLCEKQVHAVEARHKLAPGLEAVDAQKEQYRKRRLSQERSKMEEEKRGLEHAQRREIMQVKHAAAMAQHRKLAELQKKEIENIMRLRKQALKGHHVGQRLQLPPVILDVTRVLWDCRK